MVTAHQVSWLICSMLMREQAYVERGVEAFGAVEAERRARIIRQLERCDMTLGYTLTDNQALQAA